MEQRQIYPNLSEDIWYFIAHDHLVDTPATIATLSLTCRHLNYLLRLLKFRSISIRLNCQSSDEDEVEDAAEEGDAEPFAVDSERDVESSAERFEAEIRKNPGIIDHIQVLWIGEDEDAYELSPAMKDGVESREQDSVCYILTRQYPVLKHLTWSMRNVFTIPRNVLNGLDACFSLPSLSELSYLAGGLPPELVRQLQQVDLLNIAGIRVSPQEKRLPPRTTHCQPRTFRFWDEHTLYHLLSSKYNPPVMTLERLTTLTFTSSTMYTASTMTGWLKSCSSTLTSLKIFFNNWRFGPGEHANSRILDPKVFTALKEVTFGFNLSDFWDTDVHPDQPPDWPSAPTPRERIEWIVEVLRIFAHSKHCNTTLESIHLFIGTTESGIEVMDSLPWELFQALFSLDSLALQWPTLSRIHINFVASQDEEGTKLTPSQAALIEQVIGLRLADLLEGGPFHFFIQGSKLEPPSFDPFLEYATRICSEPYDFDLD